MVTFLLGLLMSWRIIISMFFIMLDVFKSFAYLHWNYEGICLALILLKVLILKGPSNSRLFPCVLNRYMIKTCHLLTVSFIDIEMSNVSNSKVIARMKMKLYVFFPFIFKLLIVVINQYQYRHLLATSHQHR